MRFCMTNVVLIGLCVFAMFHLFKIAEDGYVQIAVIYSWELPIDCLALLGMVALALSNLIWYVRGGKYD